MVTEGTKPHPVKVIPRTAVPCHFAQKKKNEKKELYHTLALGSGRASAESGRVTQKGGGKVLESLEAPRFVFCYPSLLKSGAGGYGDYTLTQRYSSDISYVLGYAGILICVVPEIDILSQSFEVTKAEF